MRYICDNYLQCIITVALATHVANAPAYAQLAPGDQLLRKVSLDEFATLLTRFEIDNADFAAHLQECYRDYEREIDALERTTHKRIGTLKYEEAVRAIHTLAPITDPEQQPVTQEDIDALKRATLDSFDDPRWQDVIDIGRQVGDVVSSARRRSDMLIQNLLGAVASVMELEVDASARLDRALRRAMYGGSARNDRADFAIPVNVYALRDPYLKAVREHVDDGRLFANRPDARSAYFEALAVVDGVLGEHELAFDSLLRDRLQRKRRAYIDRLKSRPILARGEKEYEQVYTRAVERWRVNHRFHSRIALILEARLQDKMGSEIAALWIHMYRQALCPGLMAEPLPERIVAWSDARSDLDEGQREALAECLASFRILYEAKRSHAIRAGIYAKESHHSLKGDEHRQRAYRDILLEMRNAVRLTCNELELIIGKDRFRSALDQIGLTAEIEATLVPRVSGIVSQ